MGTSRSSVLAAGGLCCAPKGLGGGAADGWKRGGVAAAGGEAAGAPGLASGARASTAMALHSVATVSCAARRLPGSATLAWGIWLMPVGLKDSALMRSAAKGDCAKGDGTMSSASVSVPASLLGLAAAAGGRRKGDGGSGGESAEAECSAL